VPAPSETLRASEATTLVAAQDKLPSPDFPKLLAIACCAASLDAILTFLILVHSDITSGYMHCAHLQLTCSYNPLLIIFFVMNYFTSIITAWTSLILHNPQQCSNIHNDSIYEFNLSYVLSPEGLILLQAAKFYLFWSSWSFFLHVLDTCLSFVCPSIAKIIMLLYAKVIDRYFQNYVCSYIWVVPKWSRKNFFSQISSRFVFFLTLSFPLNLKNSIFPPKLWSDSARSWYLSLCTWWALDAANNF